MHARLKKIKVVRDSVCDEEEKKCRSVQSRKIYELKVFELMVQKVVVLHKQFGHYTARIKWSASTRRDCISFIYRIESRRLLFARNFWKLWCYTNIHKRKCTHTYSQNTVSMEKTKTWFISICFFFYSDSNLSFLNWITTKATIQFFSLWRWGCVRWIQWIWTDRRPFIL